MKPLRRDFIRAFARSFSIQGSWNYRTFIGGGIAYALSPLLERIHAGDPVALAEAIDRNAREFNAHPYLSPIAIGALARLEHDGEDPEITGRFRAALRAPLGALGDQAMWAAWRPLCALVAALAFALGAGPLVAAGIFLVVYNAAHVALRVWGLRTGWRAGTAVGSALSAVPFRRFARGIVLVNQALMGALAAVLIAGAPGVGFELWLCALVVAAGVFGYFVPRRVAGPAIGALFAACVAWLL